MCTLGLHPVSLKILIFFFFVTYSAGGKLFFINLRPFLGWLVPYLSQPPMGLRTWELVHKISMEQGFREILFFFYPWHTPPVGWRSKSHFSPIFTNFHQFHQLSSPPSLAISDSRAAREPAKTVSLLLLSLFYFHLFSDWILSGPHTSGVPSISV